MYVKHYSDLKKLDFRKEYDHRKWFKPSGLWFTDNTEYSWEKWCLCERYAVDRLKYNFLLKIEDTSNLLIINNDKQFKAFEEEFIDNTNDDYYLSRYPKWDVVREKYKGIIIMPYFSQFRYNDWYYPWDCSSGCIWDTSILKVVNRKLAKLPMFSDYEDYED